MIWDKMNLQRNILSHIATKTVFNIIWSPYLDSKLHSWGFIITQNSVVNQHCVKILWSPYLFVKISFWKRKKHFLSSTNVHYNTHNMNCLCDALHKECLIYTHRCRVLIQFPLTATHLMDASFIRYHFLWNVFLSL